MPPRPILKVLPSPTISYSNCPLPFACSSRIPPLDSPHVHFPPTPGMTQTEITHSSFTYDRQPIVVSPNVCALPERGGRQVQGGSDAPITPEGTNINGGYFQPRAYEAVEYESGFESQVQEASLLFGHDVAMRTPPSQSYPYPCPYPHPHHLRHNQQHGRLPKRTHSYDTPPLIFDSPASESDSSDMGSPPIYPNQTQYQHYPSMSMDVSLPFLTPNKVIQDTEKEIARSLKRRGTDDCITNRTSDTSRTLEVASAGYAGFTDFEPGLEGCLGGF